MERRDVIRWAGPQGQIRSLSPALSPPKLGVVPGGRATSLEELPERVQSLLDTERRAVMTTISRDGSAHSVPVVFARVEDEIISPIDHKPKTGEILKRVKNIGRDDRVTLLVDHWDEEWERLVWLMIRGRARIDAEAPLSLMLELNRRYSQYEPDERHDALIRITPVRLSWWSWT